MRIRMLILAIFSCVVSGNSLADNEWYEMSDGKNLNWRAKAGTFEISNTKGGDEIAVLVAQRKDKDKDLTEIRKIYVKTSDCIQGYGKVVVLDLDGKYQYENSFARGADSIASSNADFICDVWRFYIKRKDAQGL